jgi:hypothetical protein
MTKTFIKLLSASALFLILNISPVKAQSGIGGLFDAGEAGLDDAEKLLTAYVNPFMKGFGTGMANGWYNTAKAHKTLGFDLTVTANLAYIPNKDLTYSVNSLNLTEIELAPSSPTSDEVPTMFGPAITPVYQLKSVPLQTFDGPEGLAVKDEFGIQAVPVPMLQLGIGIVKNTDLKIRWTPKLDLGDDGSFKLLGFGVMHDVKQHIPGIKDLPFDLSVFAGFTNATTEVDVDDEDPTVDNKALFKVRTLTVQALISKKISVLTFYGGLGFNRIRSDLNLKGHYDLNDDTDFNDNREVDPISLEFKEGGGPRVTVGMRLKLAIITFHADYTVQKYDVLTLGFGFNVR